MFQFPTRSSIPYKKQPGKEWVTERAKELRTQKSLLAEELILLLGLLPFTSIMKSSVAILSVLIITFYQVSSLTVGSDIPTACCFSYTSQKIPRAVVVDHFETSSLCSRPAIIFFTRKGNKICANPREPWVQKYVKDLKRREA
ncbi:C-C motif chemokine 4-like [Sminthopsis crassicaudata]|uniref:C-C motif chemokine 4-like n=1 Tax=Sminthopsis crassicaudata TaxID=9301 RepID=UPI003D68C557